jgi:hypothetical protein
MHSDRHPSVLSGCRDLTLPPCGLVLGDVLAPPIGFPAARVEMNEAVTVLALAAASVVAVVRPSNQSSQGASL